MSTQYRIFLFFVFGFCFLNLFTMNDFMEIWSTAEEAAIEGGKELMFGGTPPNCIDQGGQFQLYPKGRRILGNSGRFLGT